MPYDGALVLEYLRKTHETPLLTEREKHLVGLAVTMTRGCQVYGAFTSYPTPSSHGSRHGMTTMIRRYAASHARRRARKRGIVVRRGTTSRVDRTLPARK